MRTALLLAALALTGCIRSEHFPVSEPTDYAAARTCLNHGYAWYAQEKDGVRCYINHAAGTYDAQATVIAWTEGER